jgi:ESF2/ABP1 family protein
MSFEKLLGLESDDSQHSSGEEEHELNDLNVITETPRKLSNRTESNSDDDDTEEDTLHPLDQKILKLETGPLSLAKLNRFREKLSKTGVLYFSRIPPFMKHTKLRSLLSQYGEIGRIFLNPEDARVTARRKKYKKNKRVNYTEGWVEFTDKKIARQIAEKLNNTPIGGKKRSHYYDDIWNMKYLPKFKWNDLSEQLAYELKVREQKLKAEMAQAKRETTLFMKNVNQSKMISAMEDKKRKKTQVQNDNEVSTDIKITQHNDDETGKIIKKLKPNRKFRQRQPAEIPKISSKTLLSKIFS